MHGIESILFKNVLRRKDAPPICVATATQTRQETFGNVTRGLLEG